MEIHIFNLIFIANVFVSEFVNKLDNEKLRRFASLAMVFISYLYLSISLFENKLYFSLSAFMCGVAVLMFINSMKKEKNAGANLLETFFYFAPLAMLSTANFGTIVLFIILGECLCVLSVLRHKVDWGLRLIQVVTSKVIFLLISVILILSIYGHLDFSVFENSDDVYMKYVGILFYVVALVQLGLFTDQKDVENEVQSIGAFSSAIRRYIITGILLIFTKRFGSHMDFEMAMKLKVMFGAAFTASSLYFVWSLKRKLKNLSSLATLLAGFIGITYLISDNYTEVEYIAHLLCLAFLFIYSQYGFYMSGKVRHLMNLTIFSPFTWLILYQVFTYHGPQRENFTISMLLVLGILSVFLNLDKRAIAVNRDC